MIAPLLALLGSPAAPAAPPGFVPDARFSLALYCPETCPDEPLQALDRALSEIPEKNRLPREAREPVRVMGLVPVDEYGRPDLEELGALADGLGEHGAELLASSQEVALAAFAAPRSRAVDCLRLAYGAFAEAARATGGVVEEVSTGRLYDAEHWAAHAEEISRDPLDVSLLFVIEPAADEEDGPVELSTLGLRALGQHELRVDDVPPEQVEELAAVIDGMAQLSYEQGGALGVRTHLYEDAVRHPEARRRLVGVDGTVEAAYVPPPLGGPDDPVALLTFQGRFDAPPLHPEDLPPEPEPASAEAASEESGAAASGEAGAPSEQAAAAGGASASEPPRTPEAPRTLEEARELASEQLRGPVKQRFQAGLPEGDVLYVKLPFEAEQGTEYLWVRVTAWEGTRVSGELVSEPAWVSMKPGEAVSAEESEVFDYLLRHADGTSEGDTTEPFLR